jgi:hypothetical protein
MQRAGRPLGRPAFVKRVWFHQEVEEKSYFKKTYSALIELNSPAFSHEPFMKRPAHVRSVAPQSRSNSLEFEKDHG